MAERASNPNRETIMTLTTNPSSPAPRRGRRALAIATVAVVSAASGALATKAISQGFGHGGFMRHGLMGGPFDPARAEERAEKMVKHLAIEVDASKEQQDRLTVIAKALAKEVGPLRDRMQAARQQGRELLTAPTIDKAAIERLRAEQLANADAISKRLTQALGEAAEVLTAEQRKKLSDRFPPFRGWHEHGPQGRKG
jgi:Spy/CpxP family protein refolding chaperone